MRQISISDPSTSWCAKTDDTTPRVTIELPDTTSISQLEIGSGSSSAVKMFKIKYLDIESVWRWIEKPDGNPAEFEIEFFVPNSVVVSIGYIEAKALEIHIVNWTGSECCMRLGVIGYSEVTPLQLAIGVSDVDAGDSHTFALDTGHFSGIEIDANSGILSVRRGWLNFEDIDNFNVHVIAQDAGGLIDRCTVDFVITDSNDVPVTKSRNFMVYENAPLGTEVGYAVAKDADTDDAVTFSIVDGDGTFAIDSSTGKITVASNTELDYEAAINMLPILIRFLDDGIPSSSVFATVLVDIRDKNEKPSLPEEGQQGSIPENAARGDVALTLAAVDVDTQSPWKDVTYRLFDTSIFSVNPTTGEVSVNRAEILDHETTVEYELDVELTDGGGLVTNGRVTITVTDVNEAPYFNEKTLEFHVDENINVPFQINRVVAFDYDRPAQQLSYSLKASSDKFAIDSETGYISLLQSQDYETYSPLTIEVVVTEVDTPEKLSSSIPVTIVVDNVNEKPVVSELVTYRLKENANIGSFVGEPVEIHVSDPEDDVLAFSFEPSVYSSLFKIAECSGQIRSAVKFNFEDESQPGYNGEPIELVIKVNDGKLSSYQTINVVIEDVNEAPEFNKPIFELTVRENSAKDTIFGRVDATDPDSSSVVSYSILHGNDRGLFAINSATGDVTVAVNAGIDFEAQDSHSLTIQVTDNFLSVDVPVQITVADVNEAPICLAMVRSVEENSDVGAVVGLPLEALDVDARDANRPIKFRIVDDDSDIFRMDGAQVVVNVAELDHEINDFYEFEVETCDEKDACSTCRLRIDITDVNEEPELDNAETTPVDEHSTGIVHTVTARDDDDGVNGQLRFEIVEESPAGVFRIDAITGEVSILSSDLLDYETLPNNEANIKVKVTDGGDPAKSVSEALSFTVNDINDPPRAVNERDSVTISEGLAPSATSIKVVQIVDPDEVNLVTYNIVDGNDDHKFALGDPHDGSIVLANAVNFEERQLYVIQIQGCDVAFVCADIWLSVYITNENEGPLIKDVDDKVSFKVSETATLNTIVGGISASDPDDGDIPQYSMVASETLLADHTSGMGIFAIGASTGSITVINTDALISETTLTFQFDVTVSDPGSLTDTTTVFIQVIQNNNPPECQTGISFSLDENSPATTAVGTPLNAFVTDEDEGTAFTFALEHTWINVVPNSGQLRVKEGAVLNYETPVTRSFNVTVVVSDDGNHHDGVDVLTTTCTVAIHLQDVNEKPFAQPLTVPIPESVNELTKGKFYSDKYDSFQTNSSL